MSMPYCDFYEFQVPPLKWPTKWNPFFLSISPFGYLGISNPHFRAFKLALNPSKLTLWFFAFFFLLLFFFDWILTGAFDIYKTNVKLQLVEQQILEVKQVLNDMDFSNSKNQSNTFLSHYYTNLQQKKENLLSDLNSKKSQWGFRYMISSVLQKKFEK